MPLNHLAVETRNRVIVTQIFVNFNVKILNVKT